MGRRRQRPTRTRYVKKTRPITANITGMSSVLWKVGTRDNWICWICREEVNPMETSGDRYPTKDHLIPQSLGGPDGMWNLRIGHFSCNNNRDNNIPPPPDELLKYMEISLYNTFLARFEKAYGYPFTAYERAPIAQQEGPRKASAVPPR